MKKLFSILVIALCASTVFADSLPIDSIKPLPFSTEDVITSLKAQLDTTTKDSSKIKVYVQLTSEYLKYDTVSNKKTKLRFQNEALNYSYLALHLYSRYDDSTGMRNCYDNLAKVYHSQKKYPQAKWFILQSNSLSRALNDVPNITLSLVKLAAIKMDLKDYTLAMRDLNEALKLSLVLRDVQAESNIQYNYAMLYNRMKNYDKGTVAFNRHLFIDDSIRKKNDTISAERIIIADSTTIKKKPRTIILKKNIRAVSTKKLASL